MRYFIDLSYKGAPFHGWQKQPNARTVQAVVENNMEKVFRREIGIVGAGRTDTGVHAEQFIGHFDTQVEFDTGQIIYKLNAMLPPEIAVNAVYRVRDKAHARFDALSREYKYVITTRKDPFLKDFSYLIKRGIDIDSMNKGCEIIKKHRNFQCFSKVKTDVKTYNCIIEEAYWQEDNTQIIFHIKADRFLRNMVRAIVGTLLEIGLHQRKLEDLEKLIASKNRNQAGKSMAAKALFLCKIDYPQTIIMD